MRISRRKWGPWLPAVLGLIAVGCGGDRGDDPGLGGKIGQVCSVQFRRDALGSGAPTPVSPTTNSHNGAAVSLDGRLVRATRGWITIESGKVEYTIPRDAILLIEVRSR